MKNRYLVFLPDRYFVRSNEIYVSFNIVLIPSEIKVETMHIHVPLSDDSVTVLLLAQEISSGWDESLIKKGYQPPHPVTIVHVDSDPFAKELLINVTNLEEKWRFQSIQNHGIYLQFQDHKSSRNNISLLNPPYLIISAR